MGVAIRNYWLGVVAGGKANNGSAFRVLSVCLSDARAGRYDASFGARIQESWIQAPAEENNNSNSTGGGTAFLIRDRIKGGGSGGGSNSSVSSSSREGELVLPVWFDSFHEEQNLDGEDKTQLIPGPSFERVLHLPACASVLLPRKHLREESFFLGPLFRPRNEEFYWQWLSGQPMVQLFLFCIIFGSSCAALVYEAPAPKYNPKTHMLVEEEAEDGERYARGDDDYDDDGNSGSVAASVASVARSRGSSKQSSMSGGLGLGTDGQRTFDYDDDYVHSSSTPAWLHS